MQKLNQVQTLQQKLSPQQIQFIKLLQIPTLELTARVEEELEANPALEEGRDDDDLKLEAPETDYNDAPDPFDADSGSEADTDFGDNEYEEYDPAQEISLADYMNQDEYGGYKMEGDGAMVEEEKEMPLASAETMTEDLINQLSFLQLSEKEHQIGLQLIGSIDSDGYLRREIEAVVNDLAFGQNIDCTEKEVEAVLKKIQQFDPPGVGARDLQECLYIQLGRRENGPLTTLAKKIVLLCFDEFTKKHYPKIIKKLDCPEDDMKEAVELITKLNPKPGETGTFVTAHYLTPDFILKENNGKLEVTLNAKNAPDLRISRSFAEMLDTYEKSSKTDKALKEAVTFVKQKLDAAKWFIDAIKQRQETLLKTMRAIVEHQYDFFITGDESKLKPMILKDIALDIAMDISTVSRVANSKSVQTDFGLFPLKFFFSESITTETGEDVSSKEVKFHLKRMIEAEDKNKPLSDDRLEKMLRKMGYNIARRTVAKYREQLNIPVARLRKEL